MKNATSGCNAENICETACEDQEQTDSGNAHSIEVVHASARREVHDKLCALVLRLFVLDNPLHLHELLRRSTRKIIVLQTRGYSALVDGLVRFALYAALRFDFDDDADRVAQTHADEFG